MTTWIPRAGFTLLLAAASAVGLFCLSLMSDVHTVEAAAESGQAMPEFSLPDLNGKAHTLAAHRGKDVVVLVFSNQGCPFSLGAEPSLFALSEKYKPKGVVFYAIDSNANLSVEDIKKHVDEAKVPYTVLKDADNKYADLVGAKVTPEIIVVDRDGRLAYHGAPDDRATPDGTAKNTYLDSALDALTTGKEVPVKEAKTWGCGIKRE